MLGGPWSLSILGSCRVEWVLEGDEEEPTCADGDAPPERCDGAGGRGRRGRRSGAPAVAVSGCTKRYGTGAVAVDALRGVTLEVAPGEFVVILGPSGSGKTTLLNVIGGIEEATGGSVVVAGARHRGAERARS